MLASDVAFFFVFIEQRVHLKIKITLSIIITFIQSREKFRDKASEGYYAIYTTCIAFSVLHKAMSPLNTADHKSRHCLATHKRLMLTTLPQCRADTMEAKKKWDVQ